MKPTVHYADAVVPGVGSGAILFGVVDHPNHIEGHDVSNDPEKFIRTSCVLAHDKATGRIETKNTIYERKTS